MNAKLHGVHAPLVKLGTVDKEYSTAMEVAFGGRMTHIVVDDEHVASVAIELLKSSGAGRATFIPLNKIVKAPSKLNLPKDKGVIDFAINLVDFDDQYINAFYYAVGDTLVVEDMECVMWNNMDTTQRRTTERVVEEKIIVNADELERCAYCHKSKVFLEE